MANNKILGGSPLGLVGVKSWYGSDGLSTFNSGKTRNVDVNAYNKNNTSVRNASGGNLYGNSLFSGNRVVRAWPAVKADDPKGLGDVNTKTKKDESKRKELHNNTVYDTSILNIIEQLAGTKAQLRPADFAYLKNVGVYPNNRLMIARRFAGPTDDNIMVTKQNADLTSFATLISWVPENENFLSFTFGEEWQDAEADFTSILSSMGQDIGLNNLGGIAGAAGNVLPLPGFTEIFQRNFLASLGLLEDSSANMIPAGNPNLIKKAKRRKLVGYEQADAGLKCTVNIKMVCEYELKYISGIDPTIVWMDLLGMITRFGTSRSDTYGLNPSVGAKLISWVNNPNLLIQDAANAIAKAVDGIIGDIQKAINSAYTKATEAASTLNDTPPETDENGNAKAPKPVSDKAAAEAAANENKSAAEKIRDEISATLRAAIKKGLSGILQKYRVKIIGVINSLTGLPSTPWHITIGNPMRPTFCSGDMLVDQVELRLGPTLAFNDLPSSITVEFNMTNARPWGLQEIMAKFNSGYLRSVDVQKTFYETNSIIGADKVVYAERIGVLPLDDTAYGSTASTPEGGGTSAGQSGTNANPAPGGGSASVATDATTGQSVNVNTNAENTTNATGGQNNQKAETSNDPNSPLYKK